MPSARPRKKPEIRPKEEKANERLSRIHRTSMVSIGEVFFTGYGQVGPRIQDRYELVVLRKGKALIWIDGKETEIGEGEVSLLKPGHREVFVFYEDIPLHHQCWCIIRKEAVPAFLFSRLSEATPGTKVSASGELLSLLEVALSVQTRKRTVDAHFYEQLALTIFAEYFRTVKGGKDLADRYPSSLLRALHSMDTKFHSPLSLEDLAHAAGVSPSCLSKLFQKHLGNSPMHYLWDLRLQKGTELLQSSVLTVSEISFEVGFRSPFHFSKNFKKKFGLSPRDFRAKIWKSDQLTIVDDPKSRGGATAKSSRRKNRKKGR